jgi:hypothetical protein
MRRWLSKWPLVLIALAPLSWAGLLTVGLLRSQAQPSTGDPLLDNVREMVERAEPSTSLLSPPDAYSAYSYYADAADELADLVRLRAEFGDDPRYWRLACHAAAPSDNEQEVLNEAERFVKLDAPLLYARVYYSEQAWWDASRTAWAKAQQTVPGQQAPSPPQPQDFHDIHAIRLLADQLHAAESNHQLAELARAAPDDAAALYLQAGIAAERGQFRQALDLLAAGNALPRFSDFPGFPIAQLDPAETDQPQGSKLVQGWATHLHTLRLNLEPEALDAVAGDCIARGDYAGLNHLAGYICRRAGLPGYSLRARKDCVACLRMMLNAIRSSGKTMPAAASAELDRQLRGLDAAASAVTSQLSGQRILTETTRGKWLKWLGGTRIVELLWYDQAADWAALQRRLVKEKLVPLWAELATFDWRRLEK